MNLVPIKTKSIIKAFCFFTRFRNELLTKPLKRLQLTTRYLEVRPKRTALIRDRHISSCDMTSFLISTFYFLLLEERRSRTNCMRGLAGEGFAAISKSVHEMTRSKPTESAKEVIAAGVNNSQSKSSWPPSGQSRRTK